MMRQEQNENLDVGRSREVAIETLDLSISFGGHHAVSGVTLSVFKGEFLSIIGPNGAGKTTFFNLLSGQLRPTRGQVLLDGKNVTALPPHKRTRLGLGRSFQLTNVFPTLTALENVRLSIQARDGRKLQLFQSPRHKSFQGQLEEAATLLDEVLLSTKKELPASALSHGDQRKLELAMLLGLGTPTLLLDEPTAGMSQSDVPAMVGILEGVKRGGQKTILLIEHKMEMVMHLSDRMAVLAGGELLTIGSPTEITSNSIVQSAYLGGSYESSTAPR